MERTVVNMKILLMEAMEMNENSWSALSKQYLIDKSEAAHNVCMKHGVLALEDIIFSLLECCWNECNDFVYNNKE